MSSGAQAQIAASQAASAASAEAAANALAFGKEIFGQQRTDRAPYIRAGGLATQGLLNLLGLNPVVFRNPGGGGGGGTVGGGNTLRSVATGSSGSSGGSSGGSGGGRSGGGSVPPLTGSVVKPPLTGPDWGRRPGDRDIPSTKVPYSGIDTATGRPIIPVPPGGEPTPPGDLPWLVPGTKAPSTLTSGGSPGDSASDMPIFVTVTDPTGKSSKSVPASMAPYYQARGFSVDV